jgi:hypothetical protein
MLESAVHRELLSVRGAADNPLAKIEDVRQLDNEGGGDLGDLAGTFCCRHHSLMRNTSGNHHRRSLPYEHRDHQFPSSVRTRRLLTTCERCPAQSENECCRPSNSHSPASD